MKNTNFELKDIELENVTGGDVTSANIVGTVRPHRRPTAEPVVLHNMPKINPDEKYVMCFDPTDIQIIGTCGPTSSK